MTSVSRSFWLAASALVFTTAGAAAQTTPRNYIFFDRARDRIAERTFLEHPQIAGAQLKYTWRELEPERDRYDFSALLADLDFLERHGKRLFVQIQDVSFSENVLVPGYLLTDPAFNGGIARKREDGDSARHDGWVARRWDPAVYGRFIKLLEALAQVADGRIEGVNFAETAIGFGASGAHHPPGFTYESYLAGLEAIMTGARNAFRRSAVLVYANFLPGEWLPADDRGYLRALYEHADSIGVGVGGPDLLPHRRGQRNHSLRLIGARASHVRAGLAVQDGNLAEINPVTRQRVTPAELYRYAADTLRLDYIFWGTQEPYYSREVLPFLRSTTPPRGSEKS